MHKVKRNDTGQVFSDTLRIAGVVFNLTGMTVNFVLKNAATGVATKKPATIVSATEGTVEYQPDSSDVGTSGNYRAEWEVNNAGKLLTFPSDSYIQLRVIDDLG